MVGSRNSRNVRKSLSRAVVARQSVILLLLNIVELVVQPLELVTTYLLVELVVHDYIIAVSSIGNGKANIIFPSKTETEYSY